MIYNNLFELIKSAEDFNKNNPGGEFLLNDDPRNLLLGFVHLPSNEEFMFRAVTLRASSKYENSLLELITTIKGRKDIAYYLSMGSLEKILELKAFT